MADGVRQEQQLSHASRYSVYLDRLDEKIREKAKPYNHTELHFFHTFHHQAAMTSHILNRVTTPLVLFLEHDTFFLPNLYIDWPGIAQVLLSEEANLVNFHCQWEPWIIPEHEPLMLDKTRKYYFRVPMIRTFQWSQRPHLARTDFYRQIMRSFFTPTSRTFIEDRVHPAVLLDRAANGDQAWENWRLMYYAPYENGTIRRTWTSDGRESDPKYDCQF